MKLSKYFVILLSILSIAAPTLTFASPPEDDAQTKEDCGLLEKMKGFKDAIASHKFTDQEKVIMAGVLSTLSAEAITAIGTKFAKEAATKAAFGTVSKVGRGLGIASIVIAILLDAKPAHAATLTGVVYEDPKMILEYSPDQACRIIRMSGPEEKERIHKFLTSAKPFYETLAAQSAAVDADGGAKNAPAPTCNPAPQVCRQELLYTPANGQTQNAK